MKNLILACFVLALAFGCKTKQATTATTATPSSDDRQTTRPTSKERTGERKARPSIDEVFKMDTNNDGKLSKSEVKGRLQKDFSIFDSNSDGFISRTEFENAPKPKKGQRPPGNK